VRPLRRSRAAPSRTASTTRLRSPHDGDLGITELAIKEAANKRQAGGLTRLSLAASCPSECKVSGTNVVDSADRSLAPKNNHFDGVGSERIR
jgi:hypothetical protein